MAKKKKSVKAGNNYPKRNDLVSVRIKKHGDKNGGHHHIIVEDFEDKHVSVGLTTRKTKGKNSTHTNYKCEFDPLGKGTESYIRRQGTVAPVKEYEPHERKGKMSPKDYARAKEYGDKAKRKYLSKRKK